MLHLSLIWSERVISISFIEVSQAKQSIARRLGLLQQPNNAGCVNPFKLIRRLMLGW